MKRSMFVLVLACSIGISIAGQESIPAEGTETLPPADIAAGETPGIAFPVATMDDGLAKAIAEIERLGLEIERIAENLDTVKGERDALLVTKADLESLIEQLKKENAATEIDKTDLVITISMLKGKLADTEIALANLEAKREVELSQRALPGVSDANIATTGPAQVGTAEAGTVYAPLDAEFEKSLRNRIAALEKERDDLVSKIRDGFIAGWDLETSKFTTISRAGFADALPRIGTWKVKSGIASQLDANQYFSRLELPLAQSVKPTLFRFTAKSAGKGWVGLGLHVFVSGQEKKRSYGEGKSLLVWFTRDEKARESKSTFLQLYRSDSDVVMERVFDAMLEHGFENARKIEIVYDPRREYIAVSTDGILRAVYKTFFGRNAGVSVSLRTLGGGAEFQDFAVLTE